MTGTTDITLEQCADCGAVWSLPRAFCPHCGSQAVRQIAASGRGRLFSSTLVHRAPTEDFKRLVPYWIALIELEEGPRLMAHLTGDAAIGDAVIGAIETVGERPMPVFRRAGNPKGAKP